MDSNPILSSSEVDFGRCALGAACAFHPLASVLGQLRRAIGGRRSAAFSAPPPRRGRDGGGAVLRAARAGRPMPAGETGLCSGRCRGACWEMTDFSDYEEPKRHGGHFQAASCEFPTSGFKAPMAQHALQTARVFQHLPNGAGAPHAGAAAAAGLPRLLARRRAPAGAVVAPGAGQRGAWAASGGGARVGSTSATCGPD